MSSTPAQALALEPGLEMRLLFAAPDPDDASLLLMPLGDSPEESQEQARELAATLPRRLAFLGAMADRPMPILTGAELSDSNTPFGPGVEVVAAIPVTPLGASVGFEQGDVILRMADEPVYAVSDVYRIALSHVHAHSAGVPYTFRVRRGGRIFDSTSSAFFSDSFFRPNADESGEAFVRAIFRSLTLGTGLDRALLCAGHSSPFSAFGQTCTVAQRNRQLLLIQQHSTADLLGGLVAAPVPILRGPFTRLLPARGGSRVAARLLSEMAEASLIAANEAPPGSDRTGRAIAAAPWGAAVGVLVAARPTTPGRTLYKRK